MKISGILIKAIKDNSKEIQQLATEKHDWPKAVKKFDAFFKHISNKKDALWTESIMNEISNVYFSRREKSMSNITLRTVAGMPDKMKNDTKKIFLQIAEICTIFNAAHKVNFEPEELPAGFDEIKMVPGKSKGISTYGDPLPAIYKKTSLTFDYWVPKILEWTKETREKQLISWKGNDILQHESCTDFMRICLLFLSGTNSNPPIAKAEDRQALLALMQEEFTWIKKAAKREDIVANSQKIRDGFQQLQKETGITIPLEAWSRVLQASFIKSLIKA